MTDTTTAPVTDPGPPPPRPPRLESPFFAWIRGLGVPRTRGWLGGVCSGLATRIGIDPIIVRGMFVVAALIGFPALLVYAIAWALLPDLEGRIPAQELGRGRFDPAMVAIGIMALLALVPVVPWIWSALFWPLSGPWAPLGLTGLGQIFNTVLTVLLVAGVIALVVWLAVRASHRSRGGTVPDPRTASADPAAPGSPPDTSAEGALPLTEGALDPPEGALTPPEGAQPDEVAAWRVRQEEWRAQRDAWRAQQAQADAVAREQARLEREAAGQAFAAEAEARRRARQTSNPRASAVLVLAILGAALAAGAITALAVADRGVPVAATAALLIAALVVACGMVIAGAIRRRSGFLAFSAIVLLVSGLITGVTTAPGRLVLGPFAISGSELEGQRFVQPVGDATIWLLPYADGGRNEGVWLRKGSGYTEVRVQPGVTLELDARLRTGDVTYTRVDGRGGLIAQGTVPQAGSVDGVRTFAWTVSTDDPDTLQYTIPVHIDQNTGTIQIIVEDRSA